MSKFKKPKEVRFIMPLNKLKQKVGKGGIDKRLLEKAQLSIENAEFDFVPYANQFLKELSEHTKNMKKSNDNFKKNMEKIIQPIMQLKANGGMFKYQLVSDVADIALQFLEAVEDIDDDVLEVLKAHENTIRVILTHNLKGDGGREGYALVKELDKACRRYFTKHKAAG